MKTFLRLLKKTGNLVAVTILVLLLANGITLVWNLYISEIVQQISEREAISREVIVMAVVCIILSMMLNYLSTMVSGWTCETINHKLRMGFTDYLMNQKLMDSEHLSVGEQMSIFQNEMSEIANYIGESLTNLVNTLISFVITIVFLWHQSSLLTIISNLPVVLILVYVTLSSKVIHVYARKSQQLKSEMNGIVETMTNVIPILHIYDCGTFLGKRYEEVTMSWETAVIREEQVKAKLMSFSALLSCIPLLMLLTTGGILVIRGELEVGIVYIFVNLSGNVSGALMNLPGFIAGFRRFLGNLDRIENQIQL